MNLESAIRAAAADAPATAIAGIEQARDGLAKQGVLDNELRAAHMIGQCAHESARFTHITESLFYTTAARLLAVWPNRFDSEAQATQYTRNPEKLANFVYGGRLGNTQAGDGYKYRGRGYLQLTGRSNYHTFGNRIDVDLENNPDLATEPATAWLIAANYLATRSRSGKTALQWADVNNVEMVTRIVNGGLHGLIDRHNRTNRALAALGGMEVRPLLKKGAEGASVELLQHALAAKGFAPGAIDGDFGPNTEKTVKAFQAANGLQADGIVGVNTWKALEPLPS